MMMMMRGGEKGVLKEDENAVVELGSNGGGQLGEEAKTGGRGETEVVEEDDVDVGEPVKVAEVPEKVESRETEDFCRDWQCR